MRRHLPLSLLAGVLPVIAMLSPALAATQESQMWITEMATVHASKDDLVTIEDAFSNTTLVCMMWKLIRRKAAQAGYAPFGRVQCGGRT